MADYDVITLGAGHTGLITSTLLAKEGKKVLCLELNDHVGGLASNAHEFPGYTHNRGAWYLMFARLDWLWDALDLGKFGLELIVPETPGVVMGGPDKGRKPFKMFSNQQQQLEYVGQEFGKEIMNQFIAFYQFLAPFGNAMDNALHNPPVSIGTMMDNMPPSAQHDMKKIFYADIYSLVNEFFPDREKAAAIRGQIMGLGCDGFYAGPMTPGSALTLAYHVTTPEEGAGGSPYRFPKGHMGKFSETIAKSFEAKGGTIRLNTEVTKIIIKNGTAVGVQLDSGEEITADKIVSSLDPGNTFLRLIGPELMDPFLVKQCENYRDFGCREHITQAYLAMNKIPTFGEEFDYLNEGSWRHSVWLFDPDNGEVDWDDVKHGRVPKRTWASGYYIPSMMDPSLAPPGKHSMTFCNQHSWPLDLPANKVEETRQRVIEMLLDSYQDYMPDFRDCVDDIKLYTPVDYANKYHVTGGTWTHGMVKIDQMFSFRPFVGMSDYRAPFKNLYLCGTSNHPGPGISGWAPLNCFNAIKGDEKKKK